MNSNNETSIQHASVRYTREEIAGLGIDIARLDGEVKQLLEEKSVAAKSFKARIDSKTKEINELTDKIRKGYYEEPVPCDVYYNLPTPGLKVFWDPAGRRIVNTEPMNNNDRQQYLFDHREVPPDLIQELSKGQDIQEE